MQMTQVILMFQMGQLKTGSTISINAGKTTQWDGYSSQISTLSGTVAGHNTNITAINTALAAQAGVNAGVITADSIISANIQVVRGIVNNAAGDGDVVAQSSNKFVIRNDKTQTINNISSTNITASNLSINSINPVNVNTTNITASNVSNSQTTSNSVFTTSSIGTLITNGLTTANAVFTNVSTANLNISNVSA